MVHVADVPFVATAVSVVKKYAVAEAVVPNVNVGSNKLPASEQSLTLTHLFAVTTLLTAEHPA